MFEIKINKKGQITIPKSIRNKYGLTEGITLTVNEYDGKPTIEPLNFCSVCKKALPNDAECPVCPPRETIYIY